MTENEIKKSYTTAEIADLLKCNVLTVQIMLRDGRLKGFRIGRHWRVTEESLREYMNNGE